MRVFAASTILAATASAALQPRVDQCPASHVVYKYVYGDENGGDTGGSPIEDHSPSRRNQKHQRLPLTLPPMP
jgi:hypothetical protein